MTGNPVNVRRGRMVLTNLDQIKKNEHDRRRRLRLEQVRQQSKDISNRLLERARKIKREELSKLEKDGKSELKNMHNRKIMDMQRKYQEDLEDIGQAHASAALQPDANAIIEEEERKDRAVALKRGKDAMERMKEAKQVDSAETAHQERIRRVREIENVRAAMVAKLPKPSEEDDRMEMNPSQSADKEIMYQVLTPRRKNKKVLQRKSPRRVKSNLKERQKTSPRLGSLGAQTKSPVQSHELSSRKKTDKYISEHIECIIDDESDDQVPRRTVPTMSTNLTKNEKIMRYNPEDYTQNTSDSTSSVSSSNSISDDSSYFSDTIEQTICNKVPKSPVLTENKVRSSQYDHNMHQRCIRPASYDRTLAMIERIDNRNEPNAIEMAQAMKNAENVETCMSESRKLSAERRGEDAILRERVRRDYQVLLQNLEHLAQEERKLKASQIQPPEEDTCIRLHQRNKCQKEHQKKLSCASKKVLCSDGTLSRCSHLTERVITLPTQKKQCGYDAVPHSTWQDPHLEEQLDVCVGTQQDEDSEKSREEQILDMLKKVERQKRLLLQEFGSSLPDNVFNVSMNSLFKKKTPTRAKSSSPEIKVINMSSSDECIRRDHKAKKLNKSMRKNEIAVQTTLEEANPAENKSVQVELPQEDIPHSSRDTAQVSHPIECCPKTVITPESDDSSSDSTNSEISQMIIEIDKKEVIVTPKRKKKSTRISKRPSPRIYQKIRSTSVCSKATSPMKRFSKCQSSSRLTVPKKTKCLDTTDAVNRRVDTHMSRCVQVDNEIDLSQRTMVSIDTNTCAKSSQTLPSSNDQDQSLDEPCPGPRQRCIRIKDTSDTSTSLMSPPPIKSKTIFKTHTTVTPILEMLEYPEPRALRALPDISAVSTPETPSPRTMMMPSNIPHRDRIARILRFDNSEIDNGSIMTSTQNDQSTSIDLSDTYQPISEASRLISVTSQQPSSKVCICKNPQCKLLHMKLDDIHDYALKNCPEILQKYEDLQNLCAERIASLTDLIEKVRNEQKDMDLSLMSPIAGPSQPRLTRGDVQAVRRLIDNIERIHTQLASTLVESQRILQENEAASNLRDVETQAITSTPGSKLIDIKAHVQESKIVEGKEMPKIISNEKVNIQFNRFKMQQKPQAMSTKTMERNSWPPCTLPLREEEIIEKLSKEILEQSKNLEEVSTAFATSKEIDEMQYKVSSLNLKKSALLEHEKDSSIAKEFTSTTETAKESSFVPILTGISKILRNHGNVTLINTRPKPPVTLLNGLYRPELESSGHELSTIVEFDTTDTANKSSKSPAKSKPSVHVAPLPVQQNQSSSKKSEDSSSETKMEAEREYMFEKYNKQLQCNTTTEEPVSQTKDKLGSSISTDLNNPHKESKHKTTSTSAYSFSGLSGISEITSSPSSDFLKHTSSPEEMETALKKLGLGWAVTTLKKTREASALSSSSNSDVTPINTGRRMISPTKKQHDSNGFPDISDVSSISIKEASKSTEQAVLLKGRTSTPKFQNSNSNSERSSTTNTSESVRDPSDSLTVPNVSLTKTKSDNKQLQSP